MRRKSSRQFICVDGDLLFFAQELSLKSHCRISNSIWESPWHPVQDKTIRPFILFISYSTPPYLFVKCYRHSRCPYLAWPARAPAKGQYLWTSLFMEAFNMAHNSSTPSTINSKQQQQQEQQHSCTCAPNDSRVLCTTQCGWTSYKWPLLPFMLRVP